MFSVMLFLPARNEEATIGDVVARLPAAVAGYPTQCVVIDDGSTDGTPALAAAAGAEVIRVAPQGLGAAVRRGLAEAARRHVRVVAFCDADGEYAPEELEAVVAPILRGDADYVTGDRFGRAPLRMRIHRRIGNRLLSVATSMVAGRRLRDAQSGYRALSLEAAQAAEIIHDYNYAQVLTLDLLGKGFRHQEVPISYERRRHGRSFVRLGTYLWHVVPAVVRLQRPRSWSRRTRLVRAEAQLPRP